MSANPIDPPAAASPTEADRRPLTDVCFENFTLHPALLRGLESAGFVRCTPIQALTLPHTLQGRDVAGQAQTGTGKTLAFLVTVINRLLSNPAMAERRANDPRAVILAPTRELAIQIEKDAQVIGRDTGVRFALIYGGVDYDKQRETLRRGVDVIIATPGRLIDYYKQHVFGLNATEIVVLDEADRMFDLGFIKDIRFLLRRLPPREQRQALLFSATLSYRVLELAYEHMNQPQKLTVETESVTAQHVRQKVYFPSNDEKLPLLIGLLSRTDASRTMIFVNTKVWCERVARALGAANFRVGVLSGDVPQVKRQKLLGRFQRGELEILVATDVAARGLHIPDVSHVYNYDLPHDAEDYVHRIGRTARLGAEGDAISFACELYAIALPDIERYIDQKIPVEAIDPAILVPVPRAPRAAADAPLPGDEGEDDPNVIPTAGPPPRERKPHGGRDRGRDGGRRDGRREGRQDGRRDHRREDSRHRDDRPSRAPQPTTTPADQASNATASGDALSTGAKRRRRRGGRGRRRDERVDTASTVGASDTKNAGEGKPSLMARIKQGLKSVLNRLPLPGRRR
jgi:ATP-dependent RNA helicase RhlB